MSDGDWTALHAYAHADKRYEDEFLVDAVAPAADRMVRDGAASAWFFLRYWEGGPHVRVRLRDADPDRVLALADELGAWLTARPPATDGLDPSAFYEALGEGDVATHGWHPHGAVRRVPYAPEVDRYGGPGAIGLAEELFVDSTRVALAAMRAAPEPGRRRGVALNLLVALARAVCADESNEIMLLRQYVIGSRTVAQERSIDVVRARWDAETEFARDPDRYRALAAKAAALVDSGRAAGSYLGFWAERVAGYAATLRERETRGELSRSRWPVLLSQLHMLHNRMGVSLSEEYHLSWLASLSRADAALGAGFHDRGLATSARRYHEDAKYFAQTLPQQLPDQDAVRRPRRARPGEPVVSLPPARADVVVHDSLTGALTRRRSHYGAYGGKVGQDELSALLHYGAGTGLAPAASEAASEAEARRRPHPSAGGWYPTRLLLMPCAVPGIEPAVYEYLPHDHALRTVRPAIPTADLSRVSPYLVPGTAPTGVDPENVPLWLFVVGDITSITDRYGLRAYRFLLMEVGHVAQNLVLLATGLGYASLTVGGFFDDALGQLLELDGVNESPFLVVPVGET